MYPSPSFRVSDADRETVVAQLGTAAAEGRLSLSEFDARTRHVYAAKTWGELQRITRDLPPPTAAAAPPRSTADPVWPVIALVLGIVSLPLAFCAPVSAAAGVAAVVFGILGLRQSTGAGRQRGMAVAGLCCGGLGIVLAVAFMIAYLAVD